jgi:very-short-patch-repair endonuclease
MELVVKTKKPAGSGFPPCYKVDIGEPTLKIAIEVDGMSHNSLERRKQDRKKEAFLRGLGWTVLRFSNREVTERLEECVQTVLSIISKSKARTRTSRKGS